LAELLDEFDRAQVEPGLVGAGLQRGQERA
jgi:hypothetical protein